jgi:DNA-binding NarL/FixJ family response regulator
VIRVLVADDQQLVRDGFAAILAAEPDIEVVGLASDGLEALRLCRATTPDVVLMDVRMPNLDGVEATRRLTASGASQRVLMLTTFDLDQHVYDALHAGASGFLLKRHGGRAPRRGSARRRGGRNATRPDAHKKVGRAIRPPTTTGIRDTRRAHVTLPRELEVMREVARGRSNHEIGTELYLSEATIKTHVASILKKLGLRDRIQVVVSAYETGLIEPGHVA